MRPQGTRRQRRRQRISLPYLRGEGTSTEIESVRYDGVHRLPWRPTLICAQQCCSVTGAVPPTGREAFGRVPHFLHRAVVQIACQWSWKDDSKELRLRPTRIGVMRCQLDDAGTARLVSNFNRYRLTGADDRGIVSADLDPVARPGALGPNAPLQEIDVQRRPENHQRRPRGR